MRIVHDERLELTRIEELGFDEVWVAARVRAFFVDTATAGKCWVGFGGEGCWWCEVSAAFVAVKVGEGYVD